MADETPKPVLVVVHRPACEHQWIQQGFTLRISGAAPFLRCALCGEAKPQDA